jgi:hypothetical protein
MKTIFVSIYDGDTEKNILRSDVLNILKKSGNKIVLLIRQGKDSSKRDYYTKSFGDKNVIIEEIPSAMTRFELYMFHFSWNSLPTYSAYVKRHDLYLKHKNRIRFAGECLAGFMGKFRIWRNLVRFGYQILPDDYARDLFEKYKPDLFFSPNMFSAEDCRLLRQAKKLGIKTLTMAKSWDVPTTRGFTRVKADRILVFNEINKGEIIKIGDYKPEQVIVVGFPQFDIYYHKEIYAKRDDFYAKVGADPKKILVLFAVPGDFKNPYSNEIIEGLDAAISEGKFVKPIQILARFHPKYQSAAEKLDHLKHIIKDRPGTYFSKAMERALDAPSSATFQWTFTDNDIIHLANSIHHTALTINTESTMTLDAAAHDKPVVLIGFDGNQKLDYWHSIIRNYDREHLSAVLDTNGVRLAKSLDEMIKEVNAYLKDPLLDKDGRKMLREKVLYKTDGKSSKRVADAVLGML